FLLEMDMNVRDYLWSIRINNSDTALTYADWVLDSDVVYSISKEERKLIAICLTWFLTSSNRELRDISTKALVKVFQNHLPELQDLLGVMDEVNDIYVLERLYAVAYGAALRTESKSQIKGLGSFVYKNIFNVNPPEHLLLRDYARGVVEYAYFKDQTIGVEIDKVRPP